jgi:hypothetical protein
LTTRNSHVDLETALALRAEGPTTVDDDVSLESCRAQFALLAANTTAANVTNL